MDEVEQLATDIVTIGAEDVDEGAGGTWTSHEAYGDTPSSGESTGWR